MLLERLLDAGGSLKTTDIEAALGRTKPIARKEMQRLEALELCIQVKNDVNFEIELVLNNDLSWFLSDECRELRRLPRASDKANLTLCEDVASDLTFLKDVFGQIQLFSSNTPFDPDIYPEEG